MPLIPMDHPLTTMDLFQNLCTTAYDLHISAKKTSHAHQDLVAASLEGVDAAACALVPLLLDTPENHHRSLGIAATSLRPTIISAFPIMPQGSMSVSNQGPAQRACLAQKGPAIERYFRALCSRGYTVHNVYDSLMIRAIETQHEGLQRFLLDNQHNTLNPLGWFSEVRKRHHGKAAQFVEASITQAVETKHPGVERAFHRALHGNGLAYVLLRNAGVNLPLSRQFHVPDRVRDIVSTMSAHTYLSMLGQGAKTSTLWTNPALMAKACTLFAT